MNFTLQKLYETGRSVHDKQGITVSVKIVNSQKFTLPGLAEKCIAFYSSDFSDTCHPLKNNTVPNVISSLCLLLLLS